MGDSAKPIVVINRRHLPNYYQKSELQVGTGVVKIVTTGSPDYMTPLGIGKLFPCLPVSQSISEKHISGRY